MKHLLALAVFSLSSLAVAAPPKEAFEMVNKVNGVVVRTDILVKEGDRCKIYSKDIHETFITMYSCKLDTAKFHLGGERLSTCYAESSGQPAVPTAEADKHYNVKAMLPDQIVMKSRESETNYEVTVTLKKLDLSHVSREIGDSQCML